MKKCVSFLLTIFICLNFILTTYSYTYFVEAAETQEIKTNEDIQYDEQEIISDYNKLYGIEPLQTKQITLNQNTKSITNIAVFIKFSDSDGKVQNHIDDPKCIENAETILNSDELFEMDTVKGKIKVPSFKKYYETQSYGKLSITTKIFPKVGKTIVAYKDIHPIGYYLKYSDTNTIGYQNKDEALKRETELVNNAVKNVATQIDNEGITGADIDSGNDGIVDAISFFVEGQNDLPSSITWQDLLWSHKLDNAGITEKILGKTVKGYNLIYADDYTETASVFSLDRGTYGTIIHEFGHTLGYRDLYRYGALENRPVGFYDIMANSIGSNPQNLLTYFISDYNTDTNWHKPLPIINKTTNNITLYKPEFKDDNEMRAIKIEQNKDSDEYFIIEYHEKQNTYDTYSADKSGIIVYRVNEQYKYYGNTSRWR